MQLFILYAGGPSIGLRLSATAAGVVGLGLYSSAYFSEIFRGGFAAVPRGQIEAAMSVGMSAGRHSHPRPPAGRARRGDAADRQHPHRDVEGDGGPVDHHGA